jgi:hypothetical protein
MSKRNVIRKLKWVKALDARPDFIPIVKSRGVKRAGQLYENRIANYMKAVYGEDRVLHGQWYQFEDGRGNGWCQTDIIIKPDADSKVLVILECKLKAVAKAESQLKNLYLPIIQRLYPDYDIRLIQVCKNLNQDLDLFMIESLEDAFSQEVDWDYATIFLRSLV